MSLLKTLFPVLLVILVCFTLGKENGKDNGDDLKSRRDRRNSRITRTRIADKSDKIGTYNWDNYVAKWEDEPVEPSNQFQYIKESGTVIECSETGEQYLESYSDSDIYEILSDSLKIQEESISGSDGDEDDLKRRLTILGDDTRNEILGNNIRTRPQRYVGKLTFTSAAGDGWCSATLIDRNWILTAGHCIHEGNGGNWFSNFYFHPRRNAENLNPTSYRGVQWWTFHGWTQNSDFNWDIAIIRLQSNTPIGYSSLGWSSGNFLANKIMFVLGYPSDKTLHTLWGTEDIHDSSTTNKIFYFKDRMDLQTGMSGGPLYHHHTNNWQTVRGVVSHGGVDFNACTRIDKFKYDWMCGHIARC